MFPLRLFLFLSAAFALSFLCAEASPPPADQIFPNTTQGFVSIRNFPEFQAQWKQTQFGQLMSDPLMQDFKKEIQQLLTTRLKKTFGLSFDGLSSLPTGEIAFGMIAVPEQTPGFVLFMDVSGKRTETEQYLNDVTQQFTAAGVKKSTESYRDQSVTVLTFPPPETPQTLKSARIDITLDSVERHVHYVLLQDTLIASEQLPLLQLITDRMMDKSAEHLSSVESYQVVMKRCHSDMPEGTQPIVRWYLEPLAYAESARQLLPASVLQKRKSKPSIAAILKQQGFDAIQGVGGMVSVKAEDQESVYRTFVYTKKPYRLAMQMLSFPDAVNFAPPYWMPSDLARCTMFYVDPLAIFDNFGVLFDALVMPGDEGVWKDILSGLEDDPHGPQINVRNELVVHLGNRVLGMSRYEKPITVRSESIVVAIELKEGHEPAMLAGINKLFGTDPEMQGTPHRTYTIWNRLPAEDVLQPIAIDIPSIVDTPSIPVAPPVQQSTPPVFPEGGVVVAKGCLFVSTNIEYLKTILDRLETPDESAQSTVSHEAEYKEVDRLFSMMGLTQKPHFFQFFARTHETLRPTYEMIRLNQMSQSQALLGKVLNDVLGSDSESGVRRQMLEGSTLPEFEKVQHYFGKVGIYGASEENGYFIKGFALERDSK